MNDIFFPAGFLWGTATSSHQVEGGNQNNDWWEWEQSPRHIRDGLPAAAACGWWEGKAEQDLTYAAELGQNAHRLSLEWSRLEPMPGVYDKAAFARYRKLLELMHKLKLTAMVTVYHFTLPLWATKMGGWTNPALVGQFRQFTHECAKQLGDLVPLWCTINEPAVLAYLAYAGTVWPPGHGSIPQGFCALRQLLLAHAAAYHALHQVCGKAQVGLVLNMPWLEPARPASILDTAVTKAQDWLLTGVILHALKSGWLMPPLTFFPCHTPSVYRSFDFLGLNYYGRYAVRFDLKAVSLMFGNHVQEPSVRTESSDWGQIAPRGIYHQLLRLSRLDVPLYVTENGVYDNTDTVRPKYLLDHIAAVHRAMSAGADVRGYFHWSLLDNFEWAQGWSTPFGLIQLNPQTQERKLKASGELYSRICKANGIINNSLDKLSIFQ
jgi:beta-glucosidase